jgi:hypothetical protein
MVGTHPRIPVRVMIQANRTLRATNWLWKVQLLRRYGCLSGQVLATVWNKAARSMVQEYALDGHSDSLPAPVAPALATAGVPFGASEPQAASVVNTSEALCPPNPKALLNAAVNAPRRGRPETMSSFTSGSRSWRF